MKLYEKLPEYVKVNGLFCLWRYEQRNGKSTKVPYRIDGKRANSTNKNDFSNYDDVMLVYSQGGYNGVGVMVCNNLSAIDIDHCVNDDGELSPMAKDIVYTLNSYTEYSPSGKGIRILVQTDCSYDKNRYYINNRKLGLEVYIAGATAKFVTLTGNAICNSNVEYRTEEVVTVAEKYMLRDKKTNFTVITSSGSYLSDESVLSKAFAAVNGDKFKKLWHGDFSDYPSQSEAEMALCSYLAFYCGGDMEQMDRLMRQSSLYRDKWERYDYRKDTLQKAVTGCSNFYRPVFRADALSDFNDTVEFLNDVDIVGNNRYPDNDIGCGRLFADVFKNIARFVEERKKWFVYDGTRWVADSAGLRIAELGKNLSDAMLVYATNVHDENDRKAMLKMCKKWSSRRLRDIYIKEAQSVYPLSMSAFNTNLYLFNCANCTLNVKTGEYHKHRASDYLTKISSVEYNPDASSQRWNAFIDEIMSEDIDKVKYLQKCLGYGLTGDTRYECMFFFYGETTRNGKGTLVESILSVMGEYGITARPETIAHKNRVDSHAPSEDIARLMGIRFVNISEPSRGMLLDAAQIKRITGNDTLNARYLNENSFDFKNVGKLYVNTNYLPAINDMTLFSSGRIVIVPFDRHFSETEQDRELKNAFLQPSVQSAILNWLIEGYRNLQNEGLLQPYSVQSAVSEYYNDSDKTRRFITEKLDEDVNSEVRTSAVYEAYRFWCSENGCGTENCRNFISELRKTCKIARKRPKAGGEKTTMLIGYKLKEEDLFLE